MVKKISNWQAVGYLPNGKVVYCSIDGKHSTSKGRGYTEELTKQEMRVVTPIKPDNIAGCHNSRDFSTQKIADDAAKKTPSNFIHNLTYNLTSEKQESLIRELADIAYGMPDNMEKEKAKRMLIISEHITNSLQVSIFRHNEV